MGFHLKPHRLNLVTISPTNFPSLSISFESQLADHCLKTINRKLLIIGSGSVSAIISASV